MNGTTLEKGVMDALFTRRPMITMLVRGLRSAGTLDIDVFGLWMLFGGILRKRASGLLRKQALLTFCFVFRFRKPS
jgi:hypothetical protein